MSVRIHIDNYQDYYTNLDHISGNVILTCPTEETVTAVTVKLEGESFTQLMRTPFQQGYGRRAERHNREAPPRIENHKLLYKLAQVFPKGESNINNGLDNAVLGVGQNYTLPPGQHVWPFRFKIPINNGCASLAMQGVGGSSGFGNLRLAELPGQGAYRHTTQTLPPSMAGFPQQAEIKYFVKVTVQRPGIWRENRRAHTFFRFIPIEPPRPPITGQEAYARRSHTFTKAPGIKRKPTSNSPIADQPPFITVDARLPNPSILTCNNIIPLRLLVKKQQDSLEHVFLTNLQIDLIQITDIRAQDTNTQAKNAWIILSKANLRIPISKPSDQIGEELVVDGSGLWDTLPLPPAILPSFQTCNIGRYYQLELKVGIGYGVEGPSGPVLPQSVVHLPLIFPVQVFSGIPHPKEPPVVDGIGSGLRPQSQSQAGGYRPNLPNRPAQGATSAGNGPGPNYDPAYPPQLRPDEIGEAPPPSYEDAIASTPAPSAPPPSIAPSVQPQATGSSTLGSNNPFNTVNYTGGSSTSAATGSNNRPAGTDSKS